MYAEPSQGRKAYNCIPTGWDYSKVRGTLSCVYYPRRALPDGNLGPGLVYRNIWLLPERPMYRRFWVEDMNPG